MFNNLRNELHPFKPKRFLLSLAAITVPYHAYDGVSS